MNFITKNIYIMRPCKTQNLYTKNFFYEINTILSHQRSEKNGNVIKTKYIQLTRNKFFPEIQSVPFLPDILKIHSFFRYFLKIGIPQEFKNIEDKSYLDWLQFLATRVACAK